MDRKGSIPADMAFGVVFLIIIAIVSITALYAYSEMSPAFKGVINVSDPIVNNTMDAAEATLGMLDYMWLGLFIVLIIGLVVTSMMVDIHPAFYVAIFLVGVFLITLGAVLSNAYMETLSQPGLSNVTSDFPVQNYVIDYYPIFILIIFVIILAVLLAKPRFVGGPG